MQRAGADVRIARWVSVQSLGRNAWLVEKRDSHMARQDQAVDVAAHSPESSEAGVGFPIVGVGASAGGLEAFSELLQHIPAAAGLTFLFVQHLERTHKSQLADILGKVTPLPVVEATERLKVEVNHVYLIPPNQSLGISDGHLSLSPRPPHGPFMPIDHLFRTLAESQRSHAIGVILSGGGTDGTLGFQAIKAEGGITFAQDEKSAKHDSMPRAAIAESTVDYVLPPVGIAQELLRIVRHPYSRGAAFEVSRPANDEFIEQVIALMRAQTEVDFAHYKRSTIQRRVQRRMALRGIERSDEYLQRLQEDSEEVQNLYQDFLIRVTQFFRDAEAFDSLKERTFPLLLQGRSPDRPLRIWVAGCATGEEVYSLAICLLEYFEGQPRVPPIKFLATDLSEAALQKARAGVYVDNIELDISAERLRKYFVRVNGNYQINKAIRDLCVFSRHNMASDPPFSHLDLVSCRNVLIYMDTALQRRILPILHYALNVDGFLFLGSAESIGSFSELFVALDQKHRIYRKKASSAASPLTFSAYVNQEGAVRRAVAEEASPMWTALDVQREADRIVLSRYAPVGVIIDEMMTVLQFRGRTSPYLEPAPGMASLDLLRMMREGLLAEVRATVQRARLEGVAVLSNTVQLMEKEQLRTVQVEVIPFKVPPSGVRFFLVLFQDVRIGKVPSEAELSRPASAEGQSEHLQQELGALRDYLQSVIEEQESTNEELKSANEEILSANEELQSTNEELQTAKEESQSANEELATVNEELRHRNLELARVNNDLVNLLSGVNIPIVMVNRDLRIRRFTPQAEKVFNLIPTDAGRPISDIKPNLHEIDLAQLITAVIDSLAPHESEVQDKEKRWYSLRIRPYVTMENKIDGASIVLLDIDSIKRVFDQKTVKE